MMKPGRVGSGFERPTARTQMIPAQDTRPPDETLLRYAGWRAVLACFLMALFLFGFALYGQGIYLVELQRLNGWPPALISGASTLSFLLSNILATFTSEFVERLGAKRFVLLGIVALAASMAMLASATTVWQLYAAFILMSLGWIGMGTVVIATVVSLWFVRRRGLAISLAYTGGSFGGVVATPLLVLLVERTGFAAAMLIAASVTVAVLVPVALAWIGPRSQTGAGEPSQPQSPSATAELSRAKLMRSLAFWTISLPFALALVAQIGFIVHQIALLEPKVGRSSAGLAVSIMTFMSIAGRFGLGMVVDRFDPRLVTAISIVSQATALLVIRQTDAVPLILAASAVFGFSVGNLITLPPLIIHREFSTASFIVVMGLSTAISGTVGALGPGLIGVIRGWSSDYDAALLVCIVLELVAAAIVVRPGFLIWQATPEEQG
jgi:MFS family permease